MGTVIKNTFIWALSWCLCLTALQQAAVASIPPQRPHVMALFKRYLEQATGNLKDTGGVCWMEQHLLFQLIPAEWPVLNLPVHLLTLLSHRM
jgi:hypothetical protein